MKKIVSLLLLFIGTLVFFFSCDLIKMTEEEYAEYVLTGKRRTLWQAVGTPATVNSSVSTTTLVSGLPTMQYNVDTIMVNNSRWGLPDYIDFKFIFVEKNQWSSFDPASTPMIVYIGGNANCIVPTTGLNSDLFNAVTSAAFNSPDQVEYHYSMYKTIPGVGVKSVNDVLTINADLNELLNNTKWMARFNSATIEFPNASNIDDYYLCIVGEPSFNDSNGKTLWSTKAALMTVGAIPNTSTTTIFNDNTPPGSIENLQINAIPGNNSYALVSWTNPSDSDFDGVEITWTPEGPASPVSRLSSFTSYQMPISWLSSKTIFITSKDTSGNKGQVVQKSYTYNFIDWDFDLSTPNATWQSAGFTPRIPGISDNWTQITPSLTTYQGSGAITFSDQNKSTAGQSYALYFGINLPSGNFSNVRVRLRIWIDSNMITQNKPEIDAFISDNTYWLGTSPLLLSSISPATPGWYWLEYDYSQVSGSSSLLYNLTNPYLHFHLATEDGSAEGPFYVDKIEVDGSAPVGTTTSTTSTTTSTTTTSTTTTTLGPSGSTWTRIMPTSTNIFTTRGMHSSVVFDNKMWVIGGTYGENYYNDVWSSPDGDVWTQVTTNAGFAGRCSHQSVVFNNKIWVIGGQHSAGAINFNDVWSSPDGINWTQETASAEFSQRNGHTCVVFNNKIWLIGGWSNDIWSSTDGKIWTLEINQHDFLVRGGHVSPIFNNKLWIIAGCVTPFPTLDNSIWSSDNGTNWSQLTTNASFSPRASHSGVVFNNKMWVIGGQIQNDPYTTINDVWSSSDGINWTQATPNAAFGPRSGHSSVFFNDKMWVIGGSDNQVWYCEY